MTMGTRRLGIKYQISGNPENLATAKFSGRSNTAKRHVLAYRDGKLVKTHPTIKHASEAAGLATSSMRNLIASSKQRNGIVYSYGAIFEGETAYFDPKEFSKHYAI